MVDYDEGSFAWSSMKAPFVMACFAAFILLVAAAEEPFHIDELYQTRYYNSSFDRIIRTSAAQEQPPLDPILNAAAQRLLGVGDIRQRTLSVLFGVASLVTAAILMLRNHISQMGAAAALAVMALTPLLIRVTAYARPYALPLFLMCSFLLLSELWLASGNRWWIPPLLILSLLLPLSRTVEPAIFLILVIAAMSVVAMRRPAYRRRALTVAGVAAAGVVVAARVIGFLLGELGDRTAGGSYPIQERMGRLVTDLPSTLRAGVPYWPWVLMVIGLVALLPEARSRLVRIWWWWVLAGTAVGFAVAFFVLTPTSQRFWERYVFTWIPPIAILLGLLVSVVFKGKPSPKRMVAVLATIGLVASAAFGAWHELTHHERPDWKAVSKILADDLPVDTGLIFDNVRPLGAYRTPFAGYPRYTGTASQPPLTLQVIRDPSRVDPGVNSAIILLGGARIDAPGWVRVRVDGFFNVYLPTSPRPGIAGLAEAAEEFASLMPSSQGAALALTAAALWLQYDKPDRAAQILKPLLEDHDLRPRVLEAIDGSRLEDLVDVGN